MQDGSRLGTRLSWRAALAMIALLPAAFLGAGLGVAGGAYLHQTGKAFIGEAEQFWLEAFVVISLILAIPRATRWAALALAGGYVIALVMGYWAGHHWGNFIGWHPD